MEVGLRVRRFATARNTMSCVRLYRWRTMVRRTPLKPSVYRDQSSSKGYQLPCCPHICKIASTTPTSASGTSVESVVGGDWSTLFTPTVVFSSLSLIPSNRTISRLVLQGLLCTTASGIAHRPSLPIQDVSEVRSLRIGHRYHCYRDTLTAIRVTNRTYLLESWTAYGREALCRDNSAVAS